MIVRAGVVTGSPFVVVTSCGASVVLRWTLIPRRRLRPGSPGTVMSTTPLPTLRSSHTVAADPWLRTAPSPPASTAAIHHPSIVSTR
jgi:hypothetical protein